MLGRMGEPQAIERGAGVFLLLELKVEEHGQIGQKLPIGFHAAPRAQRARTTVNQRLTPALVALTVERDQYPAAEPGQWRRQPSCRGLIRPVGSDLQV